MIYEKHSEEVKVQYSVSERKVLHISFSPPALEQGRVKNSVSITSYQWAAPLQGNARWQVVVVPET